MKKVSFCAFSALLMADSAKEEADDGMLNELASSPLLRVTLSPSRKAFQN